LDFISLLIQMLSGAAGGHVVASQIKSTNLGAAGNTLAGLIGGGIGSQILSNLFGLGAPALGGADGIDIANLVSMIALGGAGGGLMTALMGWLTRTAAR
jgi:hypothetical protein